MAKERMQTNNDTLQIQMIVPKEITNARAQDEQWKMWNSNFKLLVALVLPWFSFFFYFSFISCRCTVLCVDVWACAGSKWKSRIKNTLNQQQNEQNKEEGKKKKNNDANRTIHGNIQNVLALFLLSCFEIYLLLLLKSYLKQNEHFYCRSGLFSLAHSLPSSLSRLACVFIHFIHLELFAVCS